MSAVGVPVAPVWRGPGIREQVTQALHGEPVLVLDEEGPWLEVALPWQPGPDPLGYRGWIGAQQVVDGPAEDPPAPTGSPLANARSYLGLPYVWGGLSPWGLDCSGLVHLSHRLAGLTVPRDAADQHLAATPVAAGDVRPGDLYFFATGSRVDHVGLATGADASGQRTMLHATERTGVVEEGPMDDGRRTSLVGAGRFVERD